MRRSGARLSFSGQLATIFTKQSLGKMSILTVPRPMQGDIP